MSKLELGNERTREGKMNWDQIAILSMPLEIPVLVCKQWASRCTLIYASLNHVYYAYVFWNLANDLHI